MESLTKGIELRLFNEVFADESLDKETLINKIDYLVECGGQFKQNLETPVRSSKKSIKKGYVPIKFKLVDYHFYKEEGKFAYLKNIHEDLILPKFDVETLITIECFGVIIKIEIKVICFFVMVLKNLIQKMKKLEHSMEQLQFFVICLRKNDIKLIIKSQWLLWTNSMMKICSKWKVNLVQCYLYKKLS